MKFKTHNYEKANHCIIRFGNCTSSFAAGLKVKDVVGTWSYEIVTDTETLTGTLKFEKDGKGLTGQIITDDGQIIPMSNVQIKENNVLYFEMEVDYAPYSSTMTIEGKKYTGTISADGGEVPVTGAKIE